ncbi:uncharacterized protein LOC127515622 [Ctenopharyngodon idella]|uniref:uncharacterized protein LOC127515622 n=1 Tax=Ctenopharyngodon idella TaxID=7959 RepID=UPI0022309707|nr:uncharacterized protein LOC127515622 [Ctenopharyngodon idella]
MLCGSSLIFRSLAPPSQEDLMASLPATDPVTPSWPVDFALAPPSTGSTRDYCSYGSTGLSHPSGSVLVRRRPACGIHLQAIPLRSVSPPLWLSLAPPSLRLHLSPQSHLDTPQSSGTLAPPQMLVTVVSRTISVAQSHLLSVYTQGSISIGFNSISHYLDVVSQASTMAPPSVSSAMGCSLGHHLGTPAPGSSLALPTIIATLVSSAIISSILQSFAGPSSFSRAPALPLCWTLFTLCFDCAEMLRISTAALLLFGTGFLQVMFSTASTQAYPGQSVTMWCPHDINGTGHLYWFKQTDGDIPIPIVRMLYNESLQKVERNYFKSFTHEHLVMHQFSKSTTLTIKHASISDSGFYFCGAIGPNHMIFGDGTRLEVKEKNVTSEKNDTGTSKKDDEKSPSSSTEECSGDIFFTLTLLFGGIIVFTCIIPLILAIIREHKRHKKVTECQAQQQDDKENDSVTYAAVYFKNKRPKTAGRLN